MYVSVTDSEFFWKISLFLHNSAERQEIPVERDIVIMSTDTFDKEDGFGERRVVVSRSRNANVTITIASTAVMALAIVTIT
jgi:hypothetical protein